MSGPTRRTLGTLVSRWGPAVAWAGLIFLLSAQPGLRLSSDASIDGPLRHLAHGFVYAVLGVLILHGLGALEGGPDARTASIALALAVLYGISDEVHQAFVPDRTANPIDVVYDTIGALVGIAGAWGIARLRGPLAGAR